MNTHAPLLGIDLGGTKTSVVLGDASGRIRARVQFPTGAPAETRCRIVETAKRFGEDFARVGIACGGPLDMARGRILAPPNLPGWEGAELVSWFHSDLKRPVALINDANAGALAEWRWGAGRGATDLVFLTCGTGLGAGIIAGGRLLAGACGNAGEIGHVRLTEDGPVGYGKPGSAADADDADHWAGELLKGFESGRPLSAAAQVARSRGLSVLGLTGKGGGRLAGLCDLCLRVPATRTLLVQELHLPVYHTISLLVEDAFFNP